MPAVAGTPRYEKWGAWLVEVFAGVSCNPHPWIPAFGNDDLAGRNDEAAAGGIQAYLRPRNTIFVPMTNLVTGTIHPGSESGTCFRTNSRRHSVI